jgi:hypothetical protein
MCEARGVLDNLKGNDMQKKVNTVHSRRRPKVGWVDERLVNIKWSWALPLAGAAPYLTTCLQQSRLDASPINRRIRSCAADIAAVANSSRATECLVHSKVGFISLYEPKTVGHGTLVCALCCKSSMGWQFRTLPRGEIPGKGFNYPPDVWHSCVSNPQNLLPVTCASNKAGRNKTTPVTSGTISTK